MSISEKRRLVQKLLDEFEAHYKLSQEGFDASSYGCSWGIYNFARGMAETQAWMIIGGGAPGYDDFDFCSVKNLEEFKRRRDWYLNYCQAQSLTGSIKIMVPDFVWEYHKERVKKEG